MNLDLKDKAVVVTGASKGIGYACAVAFAAEGARVVLVSRSEANLRDALARFPKSPHAPRTIAADLVRAEDAERMAATAEAMLGPVDVLVNSAGAAKRYAPDDLTAQSWHDAMDAKFFSYIHPTDAVARRMLARGRGAIVNIIGAGGKVASPMHLPGGAANAALMLATVGLAAAYGSKGIRVNGINPGGTLTGRVQAGSRSGSQDDRLVRSRTARAQPGEDPARAPGHAGRSRASRAVPGIEPGELCDWSDRSDGRRFECGHLRRSPRARTRRIESG